MGANYLVIFPKETVKKISLVIEVEEKHIVFYRPPTNLGEGDVFTGVCQSVHRGGD